MPKTFANMMNQLIELLECFRNFWEFLKQFQSRDDSDYFSFDIAFSNELVKFNSALTLKGFIDGRERKENYTLPDNAAVNWIKIYWLTIVKFCFAPTFMLFWEWNITQTVYFGLLSQIDDATTKLQPQTKCISTFSTLLFVLFMFLRFRTNDLNVHVAQIIKWPFTMRILTAGKEKSAAGSLYHTR